MSVKAVASSIATSLDGAKNVAMVVQAFVFVTTRCLGLMNKSLLITRTIYEKDGYLAGGYTLLLARITVQ